MSEIKKGDRVRVTIEDTVRTVAADGYIYLQRGGLYSTDPQNGYYFVEKIEPPVEVFGPGDVVRAKGNPRTVVAIHGDGYTYVGPVNNGARITFDGCSGFDASEFNSKDFEKVDLS